MQKYIVLIHVFFGLAFFFYLLVRLVVSFAARRAKRQSEEELRYKFRTTDLIFIILLFVTGIYPIIVLGRFELYHVVKLALLSIFVFISRFRRAIPMSFVSLLGIVIVAVSGYLSVIDRPVFPRAQGAFEKAYPEISSMSESERGKFIFHTLCVECHGDDGKKGLFMAADLAASTLNAQQKREVVLNGSPLTVMRSFKDELSSEEIESVMKHIQQLK